MTRQQAQALTMELAAGYRQEAKLSAETVAVYVAVFGPLDYAATQTAIRACLASGREFLPPAGVIATAVQAAGPTALPSPAEAWEQAQAWARKHGSYGPPPPRDALWGRAYHALGCERMAQEAPRYTMPRFLELYASLAASETQRRREGITGPDAARRLAERTDG